MKICPICHGDFQKKSAGGVMGQVEIDSCGGCGSVWFDNQELHKIARIENVIGHSFQLDNKSVKPCPRCGAILKPNHKSTPTYNISEYRCPDCQGELVVGISMHKKGARKLGLLFTVAGLIFVGLFSYLTVNFTTSTQIRASELVDRPIITPISPSAVSITFTTPNPIRSELVFSSSYLSNERRVAVSTTPRTVHQITIDGLISNQKHSYKIVLIDQEEVERVLPRYLF